MLDRMSVNDFFYEKAYFFHELSFKAANFFMGENCEIRHNFKKIDHFTEVCFFFFSEIFFFNNPLLL